jgi:hypothetical protein
MVAGQEASNLPHNMVLLSAAALIDLLGAAILLVLPILKDEPACGTPAAFDP